MADDLTKMDRWNSEPLDVHTWSDHPEIKTLCDDRYDGEPELRRILDQATHQVTNYTINNDIKNERNSHHGKVTGNIRGYEEPVVVEYHTPRRIDPTSQYIDRKAKFTKWLQLSSNNLSG